MAGFAPTLLSEYGVLVTLSPEPLILWELRGKSGKPLVCTLHPLVDGIFRLTVFMGANLLVTDGFKVEQDARTQGAFLRQDFVDHGWADG